MKLNVVLIMEVVNRTVLTLLVVIHVLVIRDILLIVMDTIVMVRTFALLRLNSESVLCVYCVYGGVSVFMSFCVHVHIFACVCAHVFVEHVTCQLSSKFCTVNYNSQ